MTLRAFALFASTFGVLLAAPAPHADSWTLPPEVKDTVFEFGETRIVLHYDSMTNCSYPRYELRVHSRNELLKASRQRFSKIGS